jgi:phosphoribosylglycinamide formyltransferase 1
MIPGREMNLGFLASHNGSNMQAIINACKSGALNAVPAVVISNNSDSGALARARQESIPCYCLNGKTHPSPESLDEAILEALLRHSVDIVILAGYMKKLGTKTLRRFSGAVLNIHPALLPKFGGKGMYGIHVHEAVLAAAEKETGVSIHLVDEEYDRGPVIAQTRVPVMPEDTPETLAARVLLQEHVLFTAVLQKIARGEITIPGYSPGT